MSSAQYELKEVEVRLRLEEGRTLYSEIPLRNPDVAVQVMSHLLRDLPHEVACVVNADTKMRPINYTIVGIGSTNICLIPPSSVFRSALLSGAAAIMVLHNHPSGSLTPSQQDLDITKNLIQAGQLMGTPLMDHVIIGGGTGDYYSIRENHPEIDFNQAPMALQEKNMVHKPQKRRGR